MTYKPHLCLDFDGVIHSYVQPWINAHTIPDPPVPGAFDFIRAAQAAGFKVSIYSSRSHQDDGIAAMKAWVMENCDAPHGVAASEFMNSIEWPTAKPSAFLTIDDRAITFDGTWPDVQAIKRFKPWNKS